MEQQTHAKEALRVVIVEDNPGDAGLVRLAFQESNQGPFEIVHVERLNEGLIAIKERAFDLVLLDLSLPDSDGLDSIAWMQGELASIPIVVLTGLDDDRIAVQAVQSGAQDYLIKSEIDGRSIVRSVRYAVERKMAQMDLERARLEAEAATKANAEFAARVSHELRHPQLEIQAAAQELGEAKLTDTQRQYVQSLRSSADSLLHLVDYAVEFSNTVLSNVELTERYFSLRKTLTLALGSSKAKAEKKGMAVQIDVDPGLPDGLLGDDGRLKQVLSNLMENALQFTQEGKISLNVVPEASHRDAMIIRFDLSDTGSGIPEENLSKIFDPFIRVQASEARHGTGIGVGLAICSRIVESMGGRIWAESSQGSGATFIFTARFKRVELS